MINAPLGFLEGRSTDFAGITAALNQCVQFFTGQAILTMDIRSPPTAYAGVIALSIFRSGCFYRGFSFIRIDVRHRPSSPT